MSDKQLNDFEAVVVLRKALSMGKIKIEDDKNYQTLLDAKKEKELTKYFSIFGATASSMGIFYMNSRVKAIPLYKVYMKLTAILGVWSLVYWTSPGHRNYNNALIQISKDKRNELLHAFDS
ncbi:hypothetical protein SteCoe_21404 [Stentor coeruleus]|uniref:Transmembrane protein n=1 Tax=Stentor coeruleus TaxID=5963 RepID=A0A1R2BPT2_9CILI|nr:hypothetical protein SteCoe_21404 [Stentor coeruleus]